jgi:hypothetical protein
MDVFPMSVLTSSTLALLGELQPRSRFDPRRLRMNVILETERPGFVENTGRASAWRCPTPDA